MIEGGREREPGNLRSGNRGTVIEVIGSEDTRGGATPTIILILI